MADLSHIGEIPDKAYVANGTGDTNVKSMQSMTETSVKDSMRSPIDDAFGNAWDQLFNGIIANIGKILGGAAGLGIGALTFVVDGVTSLVGGIADAIRDRLPGGSPWTPVRDAFRDQQLDLKNRLDLIPMGYCAAYMDRNVNLEWSGGERRLPFRAQLGPAKGAHVDTENERIVFDVTGTWTVHVLASFNGTVYGGDGRVHVDIFVRNPDGSLYSRWRVRDAPGNEEGSLTCSKPVVIDKEGMWVDVVCRSGKWRWWPGGTRYSGLAVVRSALGTDNAGTDEVPDESNPNPDPPVVPEP